MSEPTSLLTVAVDSPVYRAMSARSSVRAYEGSEGCLTVSA